MTHNLTFLPNPPARHRSWSLRAAACLLGLLMLGSSHAGDPPTTGETPSKVKTSRIWMAVGESRFAVTLADTEAARAFATRLPLSLHTTDLNNNEKKFDLPDVLPSRPNRPGTLRNGDLMLYGANTVVVFYVTFDSPYAYTRLGRVDDPTSLAQALGNGSVQIRFTRRTD